MLIYHTQGVSTAIHGTPEISELRNFFFPRSIYFLIPGLFKAEIKKGEIMYRQMIFKILE